MPDPITTTTTAVNLLKGAIESIKKLQKLSTDAAINQTAIELQGTILPLQSEILDIQSKYGELLEIKKDLEQQLADKDQWSNTTNCYELVDIGGSNFLYSLKTDYQSSQPAHYICPDCYEEKVKSILKCTVDNEYYLKYECQRCGGHWIYQRGTPPVIGRKSYGQRY